MKSKKHQKLYEHYVGVLGEEPIFGMQLKKDVLSDVAEQMKPVTTYVFEPTDELPFWKLCTIGASDYLMPERDIGWGRKANRRNEYMMFISPEVEVSDPTDNENADTGWLFLNSLLWATAEYAFNQKDNITVSDTIDMGLDGKYRGVVLLLPEVFKTPRIVKCYITKNKYVSIFQVMPVTKEQLAKKLKKGTNGIYWLMEQFYTHNDDYKIIKSKPLATL